MSFLIHLVKRPYFVTPDNPRSSSEHFKRALKNTKLVFGCAPGSLHEGYKYILNLLASEGFGKPQDAGDRLLGLEIIY